MNRYELAEHVCQHRLPKHLKSRNCALEPPPMTSFTVDRKLIQRPVKCWNHRNQIEPPTLQWRAIHSNPFRPRAASQTLSTTGSAGKHSKSTR